MIFYIIFYILILNKLIKFLNYKINIQINNFKKTMLILSNFINPSTNWKLKSQRHLTTNYDEEPNWFGANKYITFYTSLDESLILNCYDCKWSFVFCNSRSVVCNRSWVVCSWAWVVYNSDRVLSKLIVQCLLNG